MIFETVKFPFNGKDNAKMTIYALTSEEGQLMQKRPTVLVLPGGGYGFCSHREADCIAMKFASIGYNAAVLYYSVAPDAIFPQSLCEAALAMAYLKKNHEKYNIDPKKIYTCGFSAGGHLALSLGTFWNAPWLAEKIGEENELLRPAAQILCYPVVSNNPAYGHMKSFQRILGDNPDPEMEKLVSLEHHVSDQTPPTFLWSSLADTTVPCENSMLLAQKLKEHGVLFEFHLYGWAPHGLSLADRTVQTVANLEKGREKSHVNPHVATWFPLCKEWLEFMIEGI